MLLCFFFFWFFFLSIKCIETYLERRAVATCPLCRQPIGASTLRPVRFVPPAEHAQITQAQETARQQLSVKSSAAGTCLLSVIVTQHFRTHAHTHAFTQAHCARFALWHAQNHSCSGNRTAATVRNVICCCCWYLLARRKRIVTTPLARPITVSHRVAKNWRWCFAHNTHALTRAHAFTRRIQLFIF